MDGRSFEAQRLRRAPQIGRELARAALRFARVPSKKKLWPMAFAGAGAVMAQAPAVTAALIATKGGVPAKPFPITPIQVAAMKFAR
jgi:hypothetical protein